ncbi:hypothetical protein LTR85_000144 [Meristemomyces frigidus]|nr:hypothetical protein LTR85_000144 [Meristemomyces frigidus]
MIPPATNKRKRVTKDELDAEWLPSDDQVLLEALSKKIQRPTPSALSAGSPAALMNLSSTDAGEGPAIKPSNLLPNCTKPPGSGPQPRDDGASRYIKALGKASTPAALSTKTSTGVSATLPDRLAIPATSRTATKPNIQRFLEYVEQAKEWSEHLQEQAGLFVEINEDGDRQVEKLKTEVGKLHAELGKLKASTEKSQKTLKLATNNNEEMQRSLDQKQLIIDGQNSEVKSLRDQLAERTQECAKMQDFANKIVEGAKKFD